MIVESQDPNEIAAELRDTVDGDDLVLHLEDDTEVQVSVRRPLYLPSSVHDEVDGGSLRYTIEADEQAVERLDLPGREGLIAAEEVEDGSWNRSRVEFHEVVSEPDDEDDDREFGDLAMSREIKAID